MAKLELLDDIQHQIDEQIRMREGVMKLMSASSTLNQALETSKNLLTINARILGLMTALQKRKKEHVLEEYNKHRRWLFMSMIYYQKKALHEKVNFLKKLTDIDPTSNLNKIISAGGVFNTSVSFWFQPLPN